MGVHDGWHARNLERDGEPRLMNLIPISLGLTSNPGRTPAAGSARLINCYAEVGGDEQKSKTQIWASDGLIEFSTLRSDDVRAAIEVDGVVYAVCGKRIYAVRSDGTATDIGGIAGDGHVTMARNRRPVPQIGVVCNGSYVVIEGGVARPAWDVDLIPPTSVAFSDGYFVFSHADGRISHTDTDNAHVIDGLAYSAAESSPDKLLRVIGLQQYVLAFGERSLEWWVDVGADPFAFQRDFSIQVGCAAAGSVALVNQTVAFIADDKTVRILDGHSAVKVSNLAVDRDLAAESDIANVTATTWRSRGHIFYAISGRTWTWVYDLTTQLWHNRETYGLKYWNVTAAVEAWGVTIVGDTSGTLYQMSPTAYDEAGTPLVVEITTPPVHSWPNRMQVSALHLDMIPGVGLEGYQASVSRMLMWGQKTLRWGDSLLSWGVTEEVEAHNGNPKVMISASYDGGNTFGTERAVEIGRLGEYQRRIVSRRWGVTKQAGIVFRFRTSAAVMRGFMGAAIEATKLRA